MKKIIIKGNIITPYRIITDGIVIIEDEKIKYAGEKIDTIDDGCEVINAGENYISPGFIDIHTHGGGGSDFMDGTLEAFINAAKKHAVHGTTSMLPTTLTSTNEELKNTFNLFRQAKSKIVDGSQLLGLHLEGPYFSMSQRGAQDQRFIRKPDKKEYMEILKYSDEILRWTIAPELDGALELGTLLLNENILPCIGHSDAVYEDVIRAFECGYTHVTHLYSGMSGVRRINAYRYSGIVESAFLLDEMTVEIIADGCHLPASLLKLIYKIKGADHIALITDSCRAAGMNVDETILGSLKNGQRAIVEDGVAKLPDRSAFAASVATMDRLVRNMIKLADVPIIDAVKMATITPASIIGVADKKGSIVAGKDADIIIFDNDINIKTTIVNGNIIYNCH